MQTFLSLRFYQLFFRDLVKCVTVSHFVSLIPVICMSKSQNQLAKKNKNQQIFDKFEIDTK